MRHKVRDPDTGEVIASTHYPVTYDEYHDFILQAMRCPYNLPTDECSHFPGCVDEIDGCAEDQS